jgi:hypothetical protein
VCDTTEGAAAGLVYMQGGEGDESWSGWVDLAPTIEAQMGEQGEPELCRDSCLLSAGQRFYIVCKPL